MTNTPRSRSDHSRRGPIPASASDRTAASSGGCSLLVGHGNDSTLPGDKGRNHQVPS
jgi:hypothetical protein